MSLRTQQGLSLALHAGAASFSLNAQEAGEVLRKPNITRVPNAPPALDGITNLRGAVVPVFSLARLLDLPDAKDATTSFVLVLANSGMGLSVDNVSTVRGANASGELLRPLDIEKVARSLVQSAVPASRKVRTTSAAATAQPKQEDGTGLLGFELAGQDYALPLAHIEEVIALPEAMTQLPHSPDGDLGVTMLRGALLPLVSLRALLGMPVRDASRHVIVARLGAASVGFAVDRLVSVKRARATAMSPVPAILNRGGGEARIASIFRDDDGRLVSVLSPERLFADPGLAEKLGATAKEATPMQEAEGEAREQIVVFRLGAEEFGLPIAAVDEIARLPETVTRVPRAPSFVKGVMNLRGRIVPLIDQSARFGFDPESSTGARKRVIISHIDDLLAGFIVDEVREILTLSNSQIRVAPSIASEDPRTFDRVAMLDVEGRMILMVDPRELLSRAERDLIAHESWADQTSAET